MIGLFAGEPESIACLDKISNLLIKSSFFIPNSRGEGTSKSLFRNIKRFYQFFISKS